MDAEKNQPITKGAFWLICITVGVLLLTAVYFFARRSDLRSCERRMSMTVEFVKEQAGSYSKYNKIARAKALVRETSALTQLAGISMDCDEETLHRRAEDAWVTGISVLDAQCELLCEYTSDGVGYEELRAGIAGAVGECAGLSAEHLHQADLSGGRLLCRYRHPPLLGRTRHRRRLPPHQSGVCG